MSATASRRSAAAARDRGAARCSDARMIISGLRISCAMTVDRRPSDDSRSFCAASLWKRRDRLGQRVERRRQQARVLVVPGAAAHRDLPRQVAGRRHVAHRAGDRRQRPRHRAGDAVAQDRGQQHRDDQRADEAGAQRVEEPQPLGARAQDRASRARQRPPRGRPSCGIGRARARNSSSPIVTDRDARRVDDAGTSGRASARQRRGEDPAVRRRTRSRCRSAP